MRPVALVFLAVPLLLPAQSASLTYRLGKDTLAVEQYTRTASGITGVETFTIVVRALGGPRGVLELTWGDRVMSVPFTVSAAR